MPLFPASLFELDYLTSCPAPALGLTPSDQPPWSSGLRTQPQLSWVCSWQVAGSGTSRPPRSREPRPHNKYPSCIISTMYLLLVFLWRTLTQNPWPNHSSLSFSLICRTCSYLPHRDRIDYICDEVTAFHNTWSSYEKAVKPSRAGLCLMSLNSILENFIEHLLGTASPTRALCKQAVQLLLIDLYQVNAVGNGKQIFLLELIYSLVNGRCGSF